MRRIFVQWLFSRIKLSKKKRRAFSRREVWNRHKNNNNNNNNRWFDVLSLKG